MAQALVIEDERDIAHFIAEVLLDAGLSVDIQVNGQDALNYLARAVPHVVVLDLNLPGVSGVDLLHWIKQQPHLQETIIIVASGNPQMSDEIDHLADVTLFKPISYDQLRNLLTRLM